MTRAAYLVLASVLSLVFAGCGGGGIPVTGKLMNGPNPYTLTEGEGVTVNLTSDSGASGGGSAGQDGSFKVTGQGGKGIPPGKYKISITHYRAPKGAKKPPVPLTKPYPDEVEISSSNNAITIDMAKIK